jgi:hypothetical protein
VIRHAALRPLIPRRAWPKELPCPLCGRVRLARDPGDRYHDGCRERARDLDDGTLRGELIR